MADRNLPHVDVAGWLLGDLEPDEHDRTGRHLAVCDTCRAELDDLRDTAEWVLAAGPDPEPSPDLADRIVAAIDAEAHPTPVIPPEGLTAADLTRTDLVPPTSSMPATPRPPTTGPDVGPRRDTSASAPQSAPRSAPRSVPRETPQPPIDTTPHRPVVDATTPPAGAPADSEVPTAPPTSAPTAPDTDRPPVRDDDTRPGAGRARRDTSRWLRPVAAVAVAAVALVAFVLGTNLGAGDAGELELQARLVAPADDTSAAVTVRRLGSGRAVDLTSDTLPILPDGGIYELWFVGPGDSPDSPNRISAGTFHPDADGTTAVVLHAAVVPTDFPTVVITAEPNNGDPAVNGPEVLRANG